MPVLAGNEVRVRAVLDDTPRVHDKNAIAVPDSAETMGDEDSRAALDKRRVERRKRKRVNITYTELYVHRSID